MARIVVRCQSTGHFVFTNIDTAKLPRIVSGKVFCPFCESDHAWQCAGERGPAPAGGSRKPNVIGSATR